ncbi:hypothetical protein ABZZ20_26970 [Streptomyces sp. NPDC006430]|uniref:hypothetical protein n=1 Tax=Streptomyces sp. NPDC006430 TaxID=3154299 RepID=UPI0033B2742F
MTSSNREAVRLYEITYLGTGPEPYVRTVEAGKVASAIEHAGEHGMQLLVRPCTHPHDAPGKEDA